MLSENELNLRRGDFFLRNGNVKFNGEHERELFRDFAHNGPIVDKDEAVEAVEELNGFMRSLMTAVDRRKTINSLQDRLYGGTFDEQAKASEVILMARNGMSRANNGIRR